MSKDIVTLYHFTEFFKRQDGKNELYLDGAISKTYLPEKNRNNLTVILELSLQKPDLKPNDVPILG